MKNHVDADPFDFPRNGVFRAAETALVIIDMQHDLCSLGGYWQAIGGDPSVLRAPVPFALRALLAARAAGLHVIHARVGRRADVIDATPQSRRHAQPARGRWGVISCAASRAGRSSRNLCPRRVKP